MRNASRLMRVPCAAPVAPAARGMWRRSSPVVFRSLARPGGSHLCIGFWPFALTSPLRQGAFVVPSEDYSHGPPCLAVFCG